MTQQPTFKESLKQFVQENPKLVKMRPVGENWYILKYAKTVFFKGNWNEYLENCRGTIVDADFNLIAYPFQKIYNLDIEPQAPKFDDSELVTAYRKVNGFMVSLTYANNDILVSTTGSVDSPYVTMAKEMMLKHMSWMDWQMEIGCTKGVTLMFECVHPNDPHIVVEKPGMYFLGYRKNEWNSKVQGFGVAVANYWADYATKVLNCYVPESYVLPLREIKAKAKSCQHEGFVLYDQQNRSAKIKSPYYLTCKWVARNPNTDKLVDTKNDIKHNIDEEYHNLIDAIRLNIVEYTAMSEQQRLAWIRNYFEQ